MRQERSSLYPASLLLLLISAQPAASYGADEAIATDRPDFVESSDTVGKGVWQVETSVAVESASNDSVRERAIFTPTLLRYGFSDNWEARLETDGIAHDRISAGGDSSRNTGFSDVSLGLKWHLLDGTPDSVTPALAVLAHIDIDSGSKAFRGNGLRPSLRLVAEWEFAESWGLGVMPGILRDQTDDGVDYTAGLFGIVLGKNVTQDMRVFGEFAFPQIASTSHGGTEANFDFGVTKLLSRDTQIDFAISRGLNNNSPDWGATLGFSVRF